MRYWVNQVKSIPKITLNTPTLNDSECCAIANIAMEGFTPGELAETLLKEHGIFTVAIDHVAVKGIRVTPHLYNTIE